MTKNRILRFLTAFVVILGMSIHGSLLLIKQVHKEEIKQTAVRVIPAKATVVFYKDTCPDCQHVFMEVYLCKLIKHKICLVNLNNPHNRKYINRYQLKTVPTMVNKGHRYSGTNYKNIALILLKGD
ncbi:thioredoxin [Ligilactobacillus sp. LYQ139]|uniref:thioredoxin n=1 Tax=Ligilactobacillus sp. LYQ139 TaxID=3378800 RepID=UPI003852A704